MPIRIIGYIAAALTTLAFIPQVYKVFKTKNTTDISLYMYCCFVIGVVLWLIYGIFIMDYAIIAANALTTVLSSIVLAFKIIHVVKGEKP